MARGTASFANRSCSSARWAASDARGVHEPDTADRAIARYLQQLSRAWRTARAIDPLPNQHLLPMHAPSMSQRIDQRIDQRPGVS
jgi:hypothetical protein